VSAAALITVSEQLRRVPAVVRPTVRAARRTLRSIAPRANEVAYQSRPPRSKSAMWKLLRYIFADEPVVAIGTFPTYATLFFYRGRELEDTTGLLEGGGKDLRFLRLRTPADAARADVKRLVRKAFRIAKA